MSGSNGPSADIDPLREERAGKVREVGSHAIWSLSSCKPSNHFFFNDSVEFPVRAGSQIVSFLCFQVSEWIS